MVDTINFDQIVERGCGLDVHKNLLTATINGKGLKEETRNFDAFTDSIELLRDWLLEHKITHVVWKV